MFKVHVWLFSVCKVENFEKLSQSKMTDISLNRRPKHFTFIHSSDVNVSPQRHHRHSPFNLSFGKLYFIALLHGSSHHYVRMTLQMLL